jgi:hypothetical protein
MARAVVVAAPLELVRRSRPPGGALRWLGAHSARSTCPRACSAPSPTRCLSARAARGGRACRAESLHWLARYPTRPRGRRVAAGAGPGAAHLPPDRPLGDLNPFPGAGVVPVDLGAAPKWDRDAADHRFLTPRLDGALRGKPPIVAVGPELAPGLGFEGELLLARQAALRLADKLGARRGLG